MIMFCTKENIGQVKAVAEITEIDALVKHLPLRDELAVEGVPVQPVNFDILYGEYGKEIERQLM